MPIITLNPTSNTTPDPGQVGSLAVTGNTNTGHASTTALKNGAGEQTKSCLWTGFPAAPPGQILGATLKVDWQQNGSLTDGGTSTSNLFEIDYSINGGSTFPLLRQDTLIQSLSSGTSSVSLSLTQDLTQVRVRDTLDAIGVAGESASVTVTISNIRIEVQIADREPIALM